MSMSLRAFILAHIFLKLSFFTSEYLINSPIFVFYIKICDYEATLFPFSLLSVSTEMPSISGAAGCLAEEVILFISI